MIAWWQPFVGVFGVVVGWLLRSKRNFIEYSAIQRCISRQSRYYIENLRKILLATSAADIDAREIDVLIDMLTGDGDIRDAHSIERLNRVTSEAATEVRSLRGET